MNQNQWANDVSLLGPGPMMAPPFFMDGPPMGGLPMPLGGPPMPPMVGPPMPGPQMPGLQMPGLSMPGDKEIDEVVMEDQDAPDEDGHGNNRSMGGPRNYRSMDGPGNNRFTNESGNFRENRKRGMPADMMNDRSSRDRNNDRSSERPRRRSRDRMDRSDRPDRNRGDRAGPERGGSDRSGPDHGGSRGNRRERRTKWDNNDGGVVTGGPDVSSMMGPSDMMPAQPGGPGGLMPYQNNMFNMQQQQMDMPNNPNMMRNMGMPSMHENIPQMPGTMSQIPGTMSQIPGTMSQIPGNMSQIPGNNMMMNQNMGMMNPMHGSIMNPMMGNMAPNMPLMTPTQPIFLSNAVLLPPLPNTQIPNRRERPNGCRTIFIGGLPETMMEETIWEIFQRFGRISNVKLNKKGFCHLRFESMDSIEPTFCLSGCRFKYQDQPDPDALSIFIDYALNREDQQEYERQQRARESTPPPVEQFTPNNFAAISEKIKSEDKFAEAAPSLVYWLERGECNKRNANVFYSLIQASNNQVRRLFNEKMAVDEELNNLKSSLRDKFLHIIAQFEQVSKILEAAKHQRVWDHFTKQQRRNIEMWQKMTLELDNMRDEFNALFEEEDEKPNKKSVSLEKFEELKRENEELTFELEGYKNEAFVAKDEAAHKFEKFKAHFIAQQALQNKQPYHPLPPPPVPHIENNKVKIPPPPPDDGKVMAFTGASVSVGEGRLISLITAFLLVHPLGANLDYIHSYVRTMLPNVNQATVHSVLQKYGDVFTRKSSGVGASIDHKWLFCTFDDCKAQVGS